LAASGGSRQRGTMSAMEGKPDGRKASASIVSAARTPRFQILPLGISTSRSNRLGFSNSPLIAVCSIPQALSKEVASKLAGRRFLHPAVSATALASVKHP
jgi:hypothetical protein